MAQRKNYKYILYILLIRQLNIQTLFFPHVIPAKAGIQEIQCVMDSGSPPGSSPGCGRNDGFFIAGLIVPLWQIFLLPAYPG